MFRLLRVAEIVLVLQELLYDGRQRSEENVGVFVVIKFSLNLSQADDFALCH